MTQQTSGRRWRPTSPPPALVQAAGTVPVLAGAPWWCAALAIVCTTLLGLATALFPQDSADRRAVIQSWTDARRRTGGPAARRRGEPAAARAVSR
ncbi:hypothetical protein ABT247_18780 [Kitasatospora sp. NPDC001539]|uniref:hypothetical protein n=1 Tax=Kitasatospora sp. NPDC001539 TaxID=3154384 RepID=UPI00331F68B4